MKKRIFAGFALILCLCLLAGCGSPVTLSEDFTLSGFVDFLDTENVSPYSDYRSQLKHYQWNGKPVSEYVKTGYQGDGDGSQHFRSNHQELGFQITYQLHEPNMESLQQSFYTRVPWEGFTLPYGITYEDSLDTVLEKLGIRQRTGTSLLSRSEVTLYSSGGYSLVWMQTESSLSCGMLQFTQSYSTDRGEATRAVTFSFLKDTVLLDYIEISTFAMYQETR